MGTGDDIPLTINQDTHPAALLKRIRELEAALAAEKENARIGWANFETFRRKYAEIRFPGMTGEVHSASDAEGEP